MIMPIFVGGDNGMMIISYFLLGSVGVVQSRKKNSLTKTITKIFIEGFGNIAFGNYAIFCVWRIINGSGDLGIFGGVFQARKIGFRR